MRVQAAYLVQAEDGEPVRDGFEWAPEFSRRARAFPIYAALRSLGRLGVARLVEHSCEMASLAAQRLRDVAGVEVLNEVALNQVLFRFGDDSSTDAALDGAQRAGDVWLSGTKLDGRSAIRLSISNWQTDEDDIERLISSFAGVVAHRDSF
jgi:glutamate/tyrosine decarboxylase-like PLP-dependent enzyme